MHVDEFYRELESLSRAGSLTEAERKRLSQLEHDYPQPIAAGVPVDDLDEKLDPSGVDTEPRRRRSTISRTDLPVSQRTRDHYRVLVRMMLDTSPSSSALAVLRYLAGLSISEREALTWAASSGKLATPVPPQGSGR